MRKIEARRKYHRKLEYDQITPREQQELAGQRLRRIYQAKGKVTARLINLDADCPSLVKLKRIFGLSSVNEIIAAVGLPQQPTTKPWSIGQIETACREFARTEGRKPTPSDFVDRRNRYRLPSDSILNTRGLKAEMIAKGLIENARYGQFSAEPIHHKPKAS